VRRWEGRFAALEKRLVHDVDHLLVTGPPHRDYFRPTTKAPISIVMNSRPVREADYVPPANVRMRVAYFGSLYPGRLLDGLAELAVEDGSFDVEVAGMGPLASRIQSIAEGSSGRLRFLGVLPMADVIQHTRWADVVYSLLDPSLRLFRVALPNKFFEALVAGRPILVTKGTWVGDEVEAAECGLAIEYSKAALGEALGRLQADPAARERMGRNALQLARERYNWANDEANLLAAYESLGLFSASGESAATTPGRET
jgi:glycosyltransferase involved in cell wall biosynthesis